MKNSQAEWQTGHRKRTRQRFLERGLPDYELFEMLLGYAIPRIDVKPIARGLLKKYGHVHRVIAAPHAELTSFPGLGENSAVFLKGLYELVISEHKRYLSENPIFYDPKRLESYCRLLLSDRKQEEFHVLYLDKNQRLILDEMHASGTVDHVAAYPREILRTALNLNAKFVVLLHNHPDGSAAPSTADINLTEQIRDKLAVDGIQVLDHLIMAGDLLCSAKNLHLMK